VRIAGRPLARRNRAEEVAVGLVRSAIGLRGRDRLPERFAEDVQRLHELHDVQRPVGAPAVPLLGPAVAITRRALYKLLRPQSAQQTAFNGAVTRLLDSLVRLADAAPSRAEALAPTDVRAAPATQPHSAFAIGVLAAAAQSSHDAAAAAVAALPRPLVIVAPTPELADVATAGSGWLMAVEPSFAAAGALRDRCMPATCSEPREYLVAAAGAPPAAIFVDLVSRPTPIADAAATVEAAAAALGPGGRLALRIADAAQAELAAALQLMPSLCALRADTLALWLGACGVEVTRLEPVGGTLIVEVSR
jgi:hypothetical protein